MKKFNLDSIYNIINKLIGENYDFYKYIIWKDVF